MKVETARSTSTRPRTMLYQRVRRTRTESSMWFSQTAGGRRITALFVIQGSGLRVSTEDVSAASPGSQQGLAGIVTQLAAQPVHIDFNEIGEGVEGFVPDVLSNLRPAHDAPGIAHQE